jgi:hypothetical protein
MAIERSILKVLKLKALWLQYQDNALSSSRLNRE